MKKIVKLSKYLFIALIVLTLGILTGFVERYNLKNSFFKLYVLCLSLLGLIIFLSGSYRIFKLGQKNQENIKIIWRDLIFYTIIILLFVSLRIRTMNLFTVFASLLSAYFIITFEYFKEWKNDEEK